MKAIVLVSILCVIAAMIIPLFVVEGNSLISPVEVAETEAIPTEEPPEVTGDERSSALYYGIESADDDLMVTALIGGEILTLSMRDYLIGVVAAEMPASFEAEALKAQAVAARSYTLYKMTVSPSGNHPEANVCDDIHCCKSYKDMEALREKWGDSFESNLEKITAAVYETDGIYLSYDGEPILAVFHSSSGGMTEKASNVWSSDLPYLQSVESPESEDETPNFHSTVEVSLSDFKETVIDEYPGAVFGENPAEWITDLVYTESGRVYSMTVGGASLSGADMRGIFELRSTSFTVKVTEDSIIFSVTGYGHGVGMSQYGANTLASAGMSCSEILQWYYTGVELSSMKNLI